MLAAAVLAIAACGTGDGESERAAPEGEPRWAYRGPEGPAGWGSLTQEYIRCADGSAQSPIAIDQARDVALPDLHVDYGMTSVEVTDTGHTEQVSVPPGFGVAVDGVFSRLEQLHFHAPSEHHIAGRSFPVEFHFVHRAGDGSLTVVAVMAVEGRHHPAWDPILERLPTHDHVSVASLDLAALLPGDLTSTRYEGSLTTPPCSEGVHWNLLDGRIELSRPQIDALTRHYVGNNRPLQPSNGRFVAHDASHGD